MKTPNSTASPATIARPATAPTMGPMAAVLSPLLSMQDVPRPPRGFPTVRPSRIGPGYWQKDRADPGSGPDADTGKPIGQPLTGHTGWVYSVAFSPPTASASPPTASTPWRGCGTSTPANRRPADHRHELCDQRGVQPRWARIVSGSYDTTVRVWDSDNGQAVGQPRSPATQTGCTAWRLARTGTESSSAVGTAPCGPRSLTPRRRCAPSSRPT